MSKNKYKKGNAIFKGVTNIDSYMENGFYKYTTGSTSDIDAINQLKNDVAKKFPDAFVIAYKNGKRCNIHNAIKEVSDKKL